MTKLIDLTGHSYGRLKVLRLHPKRSVSGRVRWVCLCACGVRTITASSDLRTGNTTSCGCHRDEVLSKMHVTHGHTATGAWTPEYTSYRAMLARCYNERADNYSEYGGRGITVCRRWRGEKGFENFLADLGPRPKGTTLDRTRPNGNYTPTNTSWATRAQQARNTRTGLSATYKGKTRPLAEWSDVTGIPYSTLKRRLYVGDSGGRLFRPVEDRGQS